MGNLLNVLHIGQTGTEAAQFGVRNTGQNIANVNTPGYHRRVVVQEQANISPTSAQKLGDGVRVVGAKRVIDLALDRRARDAQSESLASQTRAEILSRANVIFGDVVGEGLSPIFDDLLASFDELAASPQDHVARREVLAATELFASETRRYGTELSEVRTSVDAQLSVEIDHLNSIVEEIAEANRLIMEEIKPAVDLLDRRDRLLDELAEKVATRVVPRDDGSVDVHIEESGYTLVAGTFSAGLELEKFPEGMRVVGYGFGGARRDLTNVIHGGKIGGLLIARDEDLGVLENNFDDFTFEVVSELNRIHSSGYGKDGSTGRNLFKELVQKSGSARLVAIDEAMVDNPEGVAAAQEQVLAEGGNGNALLLAAFRHKRGVNDTAPADALQGILQDFGDRVYQSEVNAVSRADAAVQLVELQQSFSGVSLDEELTNLIRYQQAYAAAAQVMVTADQLMQELLTIKR
ncbi:MAG: flagellar hook-associated protein FlgK [Myxococcales bacterium]|nr:flagellar hook-associated protein FlgK [Myxococcales bacterium]